MSQKKKSNQIEYFEGDLFAALDKDSKENIVVPHVCNNVGVMGAGFVVPLCKKYPKVREHYTKWAQGHVAVNYDWTIDSHVDFELGQTQFVKVTDNICIANMVAQTLGDVRPLNYESLVHCMGQVAKQVIILDKNRTRIICPLFGSGLAGGNWNFIEELIKDIWLSIVPVHVYYLEQTRPSNWTPPPK